MRDSSGRPPQVMDRNKKGSASGNPPRVTGPPRRVEVSGAPPKLMGQSREAGVHETPMPLKGKGTDKGSTKSTQLKDVHGQPETEVVSGPPPKFEEHSEKEAEIMKSSVEQNDKKVKIEELPVAEGIKPSESSKSSSTNSRLLSADGMYGRDTGGKVHGSIFLCSLLEMAQPTSDFSDSENLKKGDSDHRMLEVLERSDNDGDNEAQSFTNGVSKPKAVLREWHKSAIKQMEAKFSHILAAKNAAKPRLEPSLKLDAKRFKLPSENAPPGSMLKLRMVKQFPPQGFLEKPLFELADRSSEYDEMEKVMKIRYANFESVPPMDSASIVKGNYGAIRVMDYDENDSKLCGDASLPQVPNYKRVKFLKSCIKDTTVYLVEYIDSHSHHWVSVNEDLVYLDKPFSRLPARVCGIEMEGLNHYYKHTLIQKYIRHDSKDCVFTGTLTAEVQPSGKVIVWNENYPKEIWPHGINEYLITMVWISLQRKNVLPPVGFHKTNCYVVHADEDGYVCLQLGSTISKHYNDVFESTWDVDFRNLRGRVTSPKIAEVYLVPHHISDGTYYRAVIPDSFGPTLEHRSSMDDIVPVRFIDYGDLSKVAVKELILAKDVNYMLSKIPKTYLKAHLANVAVLDNTAYMNEYHKHDYDVIVHVVAPKSALITTPEVILKFPDMVEGDSINKRITALNRGKSLALPELPVSEYDNVHDSGPVRTFFNDKGRRRVVKRKK